MATFIFTLHCVNNSAPSYEALEYRLTIDGRRGDMVDLVAAAESTFAESPGAFFPSIA